MWFPFLFRLFITKPPVQFSGSTSLADTLEDLVKDHHATVGIERFPKRRGTDLKLTVDQIRAGAQGVTAARAAIALRMALGGQTATDLDLPGERQPIPVVVRLAEGERFRIEDLASFYLRSGQGRAVALRDVLEVQEVQSTPHQHRKNQLPVSYVAAAIDRDRSQPVSVQRDLLEALSTKDVDMPEIHWLRPPSDDSETALFWGGEWEITQQVYRDLAWAGLAVILVIYTLLSAWFSSYLIPLVIMAPIPLVFIAVIPAHWLMGLDIAGLGVLGVIALAGIVVRNAVLLVDFTQKRQHGGMEIRDALISAGVLRTKPILLTAGTVAFGSGALIFEPALKPLGLTLISGVVLGTLLTLLLIPMLYFSAFGPRS